MMTSRFPTDGSRNSSRAVGLIYDICDPLSKRSRKCLVMFSSIEETGARAVCRRIKFFWHMLTNAVLSALWYPWLFTAGNVSLLMWVQIDEWWFPLHLKHLISLRHLEAVCPILKHLKHRFSLNKIFLRMSDFVTTLQVLAKWFRPKKRNPCFISDFSNLCP